MLSAIAFVYFILLSYTCALPSIYRDIQAVLASTFSEAGSPPSKPVEQGWFDPRLNGGRLIDFTTKTKGEPLNVIISANSDPYVLTEAGLHDYAKSIGFSEECLGLHYGHVHTADLGDGDEKKAEQFLARQYYFPI